MQENASTGTAGEVAAQLFAAIERRDLDAVARLYSDDAEIWHSFNNSVHGKSFVLDGLRSLDNFESFRYELVERHVDGERLFQRHVLHVTTSAGKSVAIPAAVFATVKNGQIAKVFEYFDPSPLL